MIITRDIPNLPKEWVSSLTSCGKGSTFAAPVTTSLLDVCQKFIEIAKKTNTTNSLTQNDKFPGEHYFFLRTLSEIFSDANWVEIGTAEGESAFHIQLGSKTNYITTFDIIPIEKFDRKHDLDFSRLEQIIGDLSDSNYFDSKVKIFEKADIIFLDGPKNIKFEKRLFELFTKVNFKENTFLIIDDIRTKNLIGLYSRITSAKIDVSGFGHFTGTGIVDLSKGFTMDWVS